MKAKMTKTVRNGAVVAAVAAACAGVVGFGVSGAGADPGDPVTGGTTTIKVPATSVLGGAAQGIAVVAQSPASMSPDTTNQTENFSFPVTGGDGSEKNGYGHLNHGGSIRITSVTGAKSVVLTNLKFSLENERLYVTPQGSSWQFDLAQVKGQQLFNFDPTSGEQHLTASDVTLDCQGAKYLDSIFKTTVFKTGQEIGSFDTDFTNTQY